MAQTKYGQPYEFGVPQTLATLQSLSVSFTEKEVSATDATGETVAIVRYDQTASGSATCMISTATTATAVKEVIAAELIKRKPLGDSATWTVILGNDDISLGNEAFAQETFAFTAYSSKNVPDNL